MESPIEASYTLTEDRFLEANMAVLDSPFRRRARWFFCLVLTAGICGGAFYRRPTDPRTYELSLLLFAALSVMPLVSPSLLRANLRRKFQKYPEANMEILWTFARDGVSAVSPIASSEFSWAFVAGLAETSKGFLVKLRTNIWLYVPKDAFDPADLDAFVDLASKYSARGGTMALDGDNR